MRTKETSLNNKERLKKPLLTVKSALKAGDAYQDGLDYGSSLSLDDYETMSYYYGVVDGFNASLSCNQIAKG